MIRERALMLRYAYVAYLVLSSFCINIILQATSYVSQGVSYLEALRLEFYVHLSPSIYVDYHNLSHLLHLELIILITFGEYAMFCTALLVLSLKCYINIA